MMPKRSGAFAERYWLIGGGSILAALLVVSVAVTLLRGETEFGPNSAEYAVQQYLRALEESDHEAAHGWLSPELQERCSVKELFEESGGRWERTDNARITLVGVEAVDQATFVTVRISTVARYGILGPMDGHGILGSAERTYTHRYELRAFDGKWRVAGARWPYFKCIAADPEPRPTSPSHSRLRNLD